MAASQVITKIVANIIFRLKQRELKYPGIKFLVFTGTVGKTTLRDAVVFSLRKTGHIVKSNNLGYSNEIGILLTALGIAKFSAKNPLNWLTLLHAQGDRDVFVCIELGADFYHDIPWFLKRFTPFAVFISGIAEEAWADKIEKTMWERKKLLEVIPASGFVIYNIDNTPTKKLIQEAHIRAQKIPLSAEDKGGSTHIQWWSHAIFSLPIKEFFFQKEIIEAIVNKKSYTIVLNRPVFKPQLYALLAALGFSSALNENKTPEKLFDDYQFAPQRLQFSKAKNDATILEDSYKATPLCTHWFLETAAKIRAQKKILVMTEMRPLTINRNYFYEKLASMMHFADMVYFLGPFEDWQKIATVHKKVEHIIKQTDEESLILLKGSFRYRLDHLKKLLMY
jgi:UDP-N-acetylmuramyl pentapeptide synthase